MGSLLTELMEFVLELSVATAATTLLAGGVSILILRFGKPPSHALQICLPVALSVLVGAAGPDDHTSLRQWAYYVLPTATLSVLWVLIFFRKRIRESKA